MTTAERIYNMFCSEDGYVDVTALTDYLCDEEYSSDDEGVYHFEDSSIRISGHRVYVED